MTNTRFPAMGTIIEVIAGPAGFAATRDLFARNESRFSRFLTQSELSRVNRDPASIVTVSEPMAEILTLALDLRERTGGLFDPAAGAVVADYGYDRTFAEIDTTTYRVPDVTRPGSWSIEGRTLHRDPGVRLDLGGLAKGWTSDRAVDLGLAEIVSAGGDIRSNRHDTIVEVDDTAGGSVRVTLGHGGLATSSTVKRRWRAGDAEAHHLIDPGTMAPAISPVVAATAACATAAEAEAAAKAILISGEDGLRWAASQDWVRSAMVFWHDGSVYATKGWEMAA